MKTKRTRFEWARVAAGVAGIALSLAARGQTSLAGSGNKMAGYYPPPHQSQMWWLLEGAKTQSLPDGRLLVTEARMHTFTKEGAAEMTVSAPQCWYSRQAGTLSSPGPLQAAFAEGEFTLEGEGFLLHQTNFDLTVSNRVHTHIGSAVLGKAAPAGGARSATRVEQASGTEGRDLEVFSDQFSYATNTGRGIYQDHVRVAGTNLAMRSQRLEVAVPVREHKSRLESITASGEVRLEAAGIQAAGEQALYTITNDQVQVTGQPTWRAADKEGKADELVVERTNGVLHATGNATLTALADHLGVSGLLSPSNAPTATAVHQTVHITSDSYLLRTNFAVFNDHVRLEQRAGEQVEGTLTCARFTAAGAGTNAVVTAEQDVDLRRTEAATGERQRFTCAQAVYHGRDEMVELTGQPKWEAGESRGSGDVIVISTRMQAMQVQGDAFLNLPADELGVPPSLDAGTAAPVKPKPATRTFAQVYADSYCVTPSDATFAGPVRIIHPLMSWKTGKLNVAFPKGKRTRRLLAEDGVIFDLLDAKGGKHHGTGDKAELVTGYGLEPKWSQGLAAPYVAAGATNEILVLRGDPALLTDETGNIRNRLIIVDGLQHRVTTPGRYLMWGKGPLINTNRIELPTGKGKKP